MEEEFQEGTPEYYWSQWKKKPTKQNLIGAVKSLDKEIGNFANSYSSTVNPSVVRSQAKLLAVDAIKTYDPKMGSALKTHFFNHVKPLARNTKNITETVALTKHYETNSNRYVNFVRDFIGEYGREPDDTEIMDGMNISGRQLSVLNKASKYEMPEGQLENFDFESKNQQHDHKIDLWTEYVYHDLSPANKKIMDMKLGRNGHEPMTNIQIAQKLGMSPKEITVRTEMLAKKIMEGVNL
jgi:DNA-directed RNA polymerase specialized sigma subunit